MRLSLSRHIELASRIQRIVSVSLIRCQKVRFTASPLGIPLSAPAMGITLAVPVGTGNEGGTGLVRT